MTKLMEQVKAIQAWAHVCPECDGTGILTSPINDGHTLAEFECLWCDGKGSVDTPDGDALVEVIEMLVNAVIASKCAACESIEEDDCLNCPVGKAHRLINMGIPGKEENDDCTSG